MQSSTRVAEAQSVDAALDAVFEKFGPLIDRFARFLASGREPTFDVDEFKAAGRGDRIGMVIEYVDGCDRFNDWRTVAEDAAGGPLTDGDLEYIEDELAKDFIAAVEDWLDKLGN